jgi:hypothetical protein
VFGKAHIVRHNADGRALAVQVLQQLHDRFTIVRVEISGGFVGEQDGRLPAQRARHGDALLLPAGELRRIVAHAVRHAYAFQRLHHLLFAIGGGHFLAVSERQLHVFVNCEIANQIETLKDKANFLIANARPVREVEALDGLAIQLIFACRRSIEQTENREQRGFAAARRPRHGNVLSFANGQMHSGERVRFDLIGVEDFLQIFDLK